MKKVSVILIILTLMLISCTTNARARNFGGTEEIVLNKNEVLMNATWKETDLWVLVKDSTTNKCEFREYSSFGILQGKIIFK